MGDTARPPLGPVLLLFAAANYPLALLISSQYIAGSTVFGSLLGALFAHLAFLAQIGTFILAILGLLALLTAWRTTRPALRPLGAILFTLFQAFLFIDGRIYTLFRFHVNSLVVNVLTTPGGLRSAELPRGQVAAAAGGAVGLLLLQYWISGRWRVIVGGGTPRGRRLRRAWTVLIGTVLVAAVAERGLFVWANLHREVAVTRLTRLVPFYQPLLVRRLQKRLGLASDAPGIPVSSAGGSMLHYPRAPVTGRVRPDAPHVLWIVLDGWRSDLLDPETTPRIWDFSRKAQVFRRHVSGGNCTRLGIFTMFYGLHGTYWRPFLTEGRGPLLIDKFKEAGYRFRILSSTSLDYPEFKRTVFAEALPDIDDRMPGATTVEKDAGLVREFGAFLARLPEGERFFSFLFFDGSHNPFDSPPEFRKFQPAAESVNFFEIRQRKGMPELFNRYRNSVLYEDHLVGQTLDLLAERNLLERTLVVITADHGNEFYEHGYFGYNGAFTPEEINVPLVLSVPGLPPQEHSRLTVHQDLPATLLRIAGVTDPPAAYGVGRDLFDTAPRPYALSCSFTTCAIVDDDGWLVFGSDSETMLRFEGRDRNYEELDDAAAAMQSRTGKISSLLQEMRSFLR